MRLSVTESKTQNACTAPPRHTEIIPQSFHHHHHPSPVMLVHEFQIPLNMDVPEFQIAELFMVMDSKNDTSRGAQSIEVLKNEPYDNTEGQLGDVSPISNCKIPLNKGQYTLKKYLLADLPPYLAVLFPKGSLTLIEEAWNAYPHCYTYITSSYFLKHKFYISCDSIHLPGACTEANAFALAADELKRRSVEVIRIENDLHPAAATDVHPTTYKCTKTGRGPLAPGWETRASPVMTCYKLLRVQFDYLGFQGKMENVIREQHLKVFHTSSRKATCMSDRWYGLTVDDIRDMEAEQASAAEAAV
ncbi:Aste57867_865 [Aphanomyces stellatus]|uniref:Aste57867_865 protein n=1 Tax=Aphanomyces stellatus TaxID=120398 RepID=A0A485K4R2_9STRA|nr:hypothetical protein As57867_000864 [Aphanomyces stellatus]VFT78089.1 Aste57867_865 [Aphanomyces stellatus]